MLTQKDEKRLGKFLSLVLRHRPEVIGIAVDAQGWTEVAALLEKMKTANRPLSKADLDQIVANNNKKRYAYSEDGLRIRANQGHSIEVKLDYDPIEPPEVLYHGTATKNLNSIQRQGLIRRTRHHVHLSADTETATQVGSRHGKPVILKIRSGAMHAEGHLFYKSQNGVWLTDFVPVEFILFP